MWATHSSTYTLQQERQKLLLQLKATRLCPPIRLPLPIVSHYSGGQKRGCSKKEILIRLNYNYGYDIKNYLAHPCHCGASTCCGYILDAQYWGLIPSTVRSSRSELD